MTPFEKLIIRHYTSNTFMFKDQQEEHYISAAKKKLVQIKRKYKYLRDIFVKTDKSVVAKTDLTYLQKCIYQRLFFLKPFVNVKEKTNLILAHVAKYEVES
ncbi:uncharacterized protein LOC131672580 [Phymastichus coffea]|uniref:uncharacterized protein LOC131672580 n=1 Tax=Phymastichus coffea TaxID=108790 RepID=UPI00273A8D9E|nr:uncharacterized protein LOC131672580 [Phymastichus coffea]